VFFSLSWWYIRCIRAVHVSPGPYMRIAVASIDGVSPSPALSGARYLLVFSVVDEEVSGPEVRPLPVDAEPDASSERVLPNLVAFPTPNPTPDSPDTGLPDELKLAMLDCDMLLAGAFSERQQMECHQLGMLALPVPMLREASLTVRWVVSGVSSHEGHSCGECPLV
jgi:hypothetical protein